MDKRLVEQFHRDGFVILRDAIPACHLNQLQSALLAMAQKSMPPHEHGGTLTEMLTALEQRDHALVYRVQKAIATSCGAQELVTALGLGRVYAELYGVPEEQVHAHLFQAPIQFPHDQRFDFSWHQESGSYLHRSKILTCWFPVLGPVNAERGSVEVIPGSHSIGKRAARHEVRASGLNDWVVLPSAEELGQRVIVEMEPGDVLLFDSDVLHRSVANRSNAIRVTGIARTVDMCGDDEVVVMAEPVNYHQAQARAQ